MSYYKAHADFINAYKIDVAPLCVWCYNLQKGSEHMIRKIAWDAFKNTGDINAFLELKQIENIQEQIKS